MSDQTQIQKLETLFSMEEGSLSKMVGGEDVSIDFDKVRSSADFDTYKANISTEYEAKDEDRKNVYRQEGVERIIKGIRKKKDWDFEGKDIDSILKHQEKVIRGEYDGGVDKQVEALNGDVTGLRTTVETRDLRILELEAENKGIAQKFIDRDNASILSSALDVEFIKYKDKTLHEQSDLNDLFRLRNKESFIDGKIVFLDENGNVRKDENRTPLSVADVYAEFMSTRLKKPTGGNDEEGSSDPSGMKTTQQVSESMTKQGKSQTEIMLEVQRLSKLGLIK